MAALTDSTALDRHSGSGEVMVPLPKCGYLRSNTEGLSWSVLAAVTKYHKLVTLKK